MEPGGVRSFNSVREYLLATLSDRRARNPRYTVSAWARQLGYRNSSLLADVLAGRRRVNETMRTKLVQNLVLDGDDRRHFELLSLVESARTPTDRARFLDSLTAVTPGFSFHNVELDDFNLIKEWHHIPIAEMVQLRDFVEDPALIARRLGGGLTAADVRDAIDRLLRVGMLRRDADGRLQKSHKHQMVGANVPNAAIRHHHRQFIEKAMKALDTKPVGERHISGTTIAVAEQDVPRVHELIMRFHRELQSLVGRGPADQVYRINVQCFGLTKES